MRQTTPTYKLNDFHIYGSSRLGVRQEDLSITSTGSSTLDLTYRELGNKRYELSNHLGNVLEVISDRKLAKEEVTHHAKFNGSGQYINLGTGSRGIVNEVTVEFMMKTTTNSSAGQAIVSDYGNPNVYGGYTVFLKQGKIEIHGRNSSDGIFKISGSNGTISVADGQWHHIAAVITPSDVWEVYIDGVLSESINYGSTVNDLTNGVNLTIGRHYYNGLNYSGELKEVSIWNRAKSQSEIQQDRTSYFIGNETNLVSYLKLDEPTGGYQDKVTGGYYNNSPRPTSIAEGSVYYTADVISYSDYYPFGMLMPNRYTGGSKYRYSFNGMEKDNEISSNGNSYTTPFRQYDPRIGRWYSLDLIIKPWESRYASYKNNPIFFNDPLGLDPPQRFAWYKRAWNWLTGEGYKNKANKYAVENNIDEKNIKYGKDGITVYNDWYTLTAGDGESTISSELPGVTMHSEETYFKDKVHFKTGVDAKVDVGVQAGIKYGGFKAELNLYSIELISAKGSFSEKDSWDGDWSYCGKNGRVKHKQEIALKVKSPIGFKDFVPEFGGKLGQTFETEGDDMEYVPNSQKTFYDLSLGVPVLKKGTESVVEDMAKGAAEAIMGELQRKVIPKASTTGDDNFVGIDVDFKAALIIGIEIKFKIGFDYED